MKINYQTALHNIAESLRLYHHLDVDIKEVYGSDFFPSNEVGTDSENVETFRLRFNPKVLTILALYNLSMEYGYDTGNAVIHYALFHAYLEVHNYAGAERHLQGFRKEVLALPIAKRSEEETNNANFQLTVQLLFILFHESFHLILHHEPSNRQIAHDITLSLLRDIKEELEYHMSLFSEKELQNHPEIKASIDRMIPKDLSFVERFTMRIAISKYGKENAFTPAFIEEAIQKDTVLMEEISCDRQAWLNLLPLFENDGMSNQDVLQLHLWVFTVFNAMDFNKRLLSNYVPALYEKYHYDGRKVLLRHKAFKALLRQYSPDVDKIIKKEYVELHKGLEAIYRSSIMAFKNFGQDMAEIYACYRKGFQLPDIKRHAELTRAMEEAADVLV